MHIDKYFGEFRTSENSIIDKLEETNFFLKKMYTEKDSESIKPMKYYFSALISASKSVILIIKTQYKKFLKNPKKIEEYLSAKSEFDKKWGFMTVYRDKNIHQGKPIIKRSTFITVRKKDFKKVEAKMTREKEKNKLTFRSKKGIENKIPALQTKEWFLRDRTDKPLLNYCKEYVQDLEKCVKALHH